LKSDAPIFCRATGKSAEREEFDERFADIAIIVDNQEHCESQLDGPLADWAQRSCHSKSSEDR
jgi:hypothetical protein